MRDSWEWTEGDILSLIHNKISESTVLEYKACDALGKTESKKKEISKDVSAFANSAGGTIVYGVTENSAHEPDAIDSLRSMRRRATVPQSFRKGLRRWGESGCKP